VTQGESPPAAYAAALAALPGIGPVTLVGLLTRHDPQTAWARVLAGAERRPGPRTGAAAGAGRTPTPWAVAAGRADVAGRWAALVEAKIGVTWIGHAQYPAVLAVDPDPPGVVFWRGDLDALDRLCVAIVGTRRCTHYGREVAAELGQDLAGAGVCVVSGLALGIDGAAHGGALEAGGAGPVGVAASGVDVVYPRRHAHLWARVTAAGAIISETAPGHQAQAWRFPARNRIIAGLARVVVVVESHAGGGSLLTVDAALDRGIDVAAVPGPVHSPASTGTNQLLVDGARPVRHAGDVLQALGDLRPWPPPAQLPLPGTEIDTARAAPPDRLDAGAQRVLDAVDWTPTPVGTVAGRTGLAIAPLSMALHRLEGLGLVRDGGGWWERTRCSRSTETQK